MKTLIKTLGIIVIIAITTTLISSTPEKIEPEKITDAKFIIPKNIQLILDKSCVICHSSKSKNTKGKAKLNIDNMLNGEYSLQKIASKLRGINKAVMIKKTMPTKKFIKNYPDKVITEKERKILSDWVITQSELIKPSK